MRETRVFPANPAHNDSNASGALQKGGTTICALHKNNGWGSTVNAIGRFLRMPGLLTDGGKH